MGDTGVSYISNGTAIYHNPAGLDGIKTFSATVGLIMSTLFSNRVPLDGPDTKVSGKVDSIPAPYLGLGYRLNDHVVVGISAYPLAGGAAFYDDVKSLGGQDIRVAAAFLELSPGASFKITKDLTFGAALRFIYMFQQSEIPTLVGDQIVPVESTASGLDAAGLHIGLTYRPVKDIQLGFSFRSKTAVDMSGTTTTAGVETDYRTLAAMPHRFKLGAAYSLLDEKLLLSVDMKFLLYGDSHDEAITIVNTPTGRIAQVTPVNWKDAAGIGIGAEYTVIPLLSLRAGYSLSSSAVPSESVNYFSPPSTPTYSFHAGAGLHLERFDIDLGGLYLETGGYLAPPHAFRGEYSTSAAILFLSGTYHI